MDHEAHRHINTSSDSELLLIVFASNLQKTGKFRINEEDIFTAIGDLMTQCKGAYACIAMVAGFGLIAFRDPNGIRPLGMAHRHSDSGSDYLFASESVVADASEFVDWVDVKPGRSHCHHTSPHVLIPASRRRSHYRYPLKSFKTSGAPNDNVCA